MEADKVAREWGANIRAQRALKSMTQQQLADLVGVTQRAVSNWEHGVSSPSLRHQVLIATHLECSPRALFTFPQVAA